MKDRAADPPPRHYERLQLAFAPRALLWLVAATLCGSGLVLAVRPALSSGTTSAAGILLTVGAVGVVAARRLGAYEIVLTRGALRAGFGPFSQAVALWDVRRVSSQAATGWRRLYASWELLLETRSAAGTKVLRLATDAPDELSALLAPDPQRTGA